MSYVMVCRGEACRAKGADAIWHQCLEAFVMVKARGEPPTVLPIESPCLRQCEQAPVVRLASNTSALTDADPAAIATRAAELIRSKNDAPHR
jgi:NADH:ubiquinone oxidoreductase subunit E